MTQKKTQLLDTIRELNISGKYETYNKWGKDYTLLHSRARYYGVISEAREILGFGDVVRWTKFKCSKIAKNYSSPTEWLGKHPRSYKAAVYYKWINFCTIHMKDTKQYTPITKEQCIVTAKKYSSKTLWQISKIKTHRQHFLIAKRNGWLVDCIYNNNGNIKWSKEKCIDFAKDFNSCNDLKINGGSCYDIARINGWLADVKKVLYN